MDITNIASDTLFETCDLRREVSEESSTWSYVSPERMKYTVTISSVFEPGPGLWNIKVSPQNCPFKWEVRRKYEDFEELDKCLRSSEELSPISGLLPRLPVPPDCDEDSMFLAAFLEQVLHCADDYLYSCLPILSFLDDSLGAGGGFKDVHISILEEKIQRLSVAYRTLETKFYDAQDSWESISLRMMRLENARQEDDEAAANCSEPDYANSIAIHNESHLANIEDYFQPDDFGLVPVPISTLPPATSLRSTDRGDSELTDTLVLDTSNSDPAPSPTSPFSTSETVRAVTDSDSPVSPSAKEFQGETVTTEHLKENPDNVPSTMILATNEGVLNMDLQTILACIGVEEDNTDADLRTDLERSFSQTCNLEQLRELVADAVPLARPEPPRVHSYKACRYLPESLIPENAEPDARDAAVGVVLSLLKPYDAQLLYRSSARAFLGRAVRNSLNAKLFESGLHALQTFLPDDPIRLTVLLWRGNSTNWLANLSDKLRVLEQPGGGGSGRLGGAMGQGGMGMGGNPAFDEEAFNDVNGFDIDNEPKPTGEHIITNINPSTNNGHSRMLCTIDAVPVEIMPNGRSDLCFLALVEEISQLVGKKDLFKCSLLLIRGWWTYESSAYAGVSTKSFLSDSVLCVLVCSIFNQYHDVINQPLQALCVFLAEYSDVKWSDVAVTLQGVVPFHSNSVLDNQPWLRQPLPCELITSTILQKHCDFYHMSSASNSRASATPQVAVIEVPSELRDVAGSSKETTSSSGITTVCGTPYSSSETASRDIMSTSFNPILSSSSTRLTPPSSAAPTPGTATPYGSCTVSTAATVAAAAALLTPKEPAQASTKKVPSDSHCYSPTAVRNFQKRLINVVHPLTNANMISTSLTADRVSKISQIFEIGARDLGTALKLASRSDGLEEDSDLPSVQTHFNSFFRNILGRFAGGWRPDMFPDAAASSKLASFCDTGKSMYDGTHDQAGTPRGVAAFSKISLNDLFDQIRYIDLVLVGRVSESALLSLSLDILVGRGVLPVGEIGKSLQDIAPTRNLSGKIKEKYGGLKKFLERYPEEVVICADHPFNPHVFLRKPLNRGDLELIAKGVIPPHLRKAMALRNKMRGGGMSNIGQDGHNGYANSHMGSLQGMEGGGPVRHMNPNMERNMNSSGVVGMNLLNAYGPHGNMGVQGHQGQGVNTRLNHQMQQQAFKTQQLALQQQQQQQQQQQLFAHQQQPQGGQYRGQDPLSLYAQGGGQSGNSPHFFPMRDGDQMLGPRGGMGDSHLMRGGVTQAGINQPNGGLVGGLIGQDFSQVQLRRSGSTGGIGNSMGGDLNMGSSLSEPYGAFGARRGLGDSPHSALQVGDGLGLGRSLSSFSSQVDAGGQSRRYGDLSLSGGLGLSSDNLAHDRNGSINVGGTSFDLNSTQDRPLDRRFSEPFREHSEGLGSANVFNPAMSQGLGNGNQSSRRASASMQQAAKSFSERDKMERDRSLGMEPWGDSVFSDRDAVDDRLRDRDRERYAEVDFGLDVGSELLTSSALGVGNSSGALLPEDSSGEYYDPRSQRGFQQSLRDPYLRGLEGAQDHHTHHQGQGLSSQSQSTGSSLFLQLRDDEMLYEQEYSMRDRQQHQLQLQRQQQDDEEQQQRLILQNQQANAQRQGFRPASNVFDPKKWI